MIFHADMQRITVLWIYFPVTVALIANDQTRGTVHIFRKFIYVFILAQVGHSRA